MSTLETRKIEPLSGTTVTLGAAGDAVTMPAGVTVKTNTVKDAGGNTIWTSNGSGTLSSVNSALTGNMIFISSQTASFTSTIDFESGIDSTYDEYVFYFINMHPSAASAEWKFQVNATDGADYNDSLITSTFFYVAQSEGGTVEQSPPGYQTSYDLAQSANFQPMNENVGGDTDESLAGELHLFTPSNTTYMKQFYTIVHSYRSDNYAHTGYVAGYVNDTTAIDEIRFKMASGTIESGTIAMYGIL